MSLLPAVIGALGSLGAGAMTSSSLDDQNRAAQSQFRENMAWQKQQYYDMKQWQSPMNQVRLYKEAGINPALALGSGLAGKVEGVGGVSPTSSMAYQDYSSFPTAAGNLASAFASSSLQSKQESLVDSEVEKNLAEAQGQRTDNLYKDEYWKSSNYLRNSQAYLADKNADVMKLQYEFDKDSLGDRLFQKRWESEYMRAETEARLLTNAFIPERCRAEIDKVYTDQKVALMSGQASLTSAAAAMQNAISQTHAFDAQFGGNPKMRKLYFDNVLKNFAQARNLSKAQEFNAWQKGVKIGPAEFLNPWGARNANRVANSYGK